MNKETKKELISPLIELDHILMMCIPNPKKKFEKFIEIRDKIDYTSDDLKKFNDDILNDLWCDKDLKKIIKARRLLYSVIESQFAKYYEQQRINKEIDFLIEQNELMEQYLNPVDKKEGKVNNTLHTKKNF